MQFNIPPEILAQIQGQRQQQKIEIPVEKLDLFIDRCCNERDETLFTLAQALAWKIEKAPMCSIPELQVYPLVLRRIEERLNKGEQ